MRIKLYRPKKSLINWRKAKGKHDDNIPKYDECQQMKKNKNES